MAKISFVPDKYRRSRDGTKEYNIIVNDRYLGCLLKRDGRWHLISNFLYGIDWRTLKEAKGAVVAYVNEREKAIKADQDSGH